MAGNGKVVHNGRVTRKPDVDFAFDPNSMSVGDLIDLEEAFGVTLDTLMNLVNSAGRIQDLTGKTIAALTFVVKRQQDGPDFTPEMARAVKLDELLTLMGNGQRDQDKPKSRRLAGTGTRPRTDPTAAG